MNSSKVLHGANSTVQNPLMLGMLVALDMPIFWTWLTPTTGGYIEVPLLLLHAPRMCTGMSSEPSTPCPRSTSTSSRLTWRLPKDTLVIEPSMSLEIEERSNLRPLLPMLWSTWRRADPIEPGTKRTRTRAPKVLVDQVAMSGWPWVSSAPRDSSWAASSSVSSPVLLSS